MPSLSAPTTEELIIAAHKLLDAIVEYRRSNDTRISTIPPPPATPTFNVMSAADLMETDQDVLRLRDMVADPVVGALKRELHDIGQAIFNRVGSTEKLLDVGERIANADPDQYSRRMSPLDSAWNGVGKGSDRWLS